MGMPKANAILCDTKGVIYQGRKEGMNQWKSAYAAKTKARTLTEALDGADALFGLSVKGAVTGEMVRAMAPKPIIFAMANPDPEITPEDVAAVRDDAIVATGREHRRKENHPKPRDAVFGQEQWGTTDANRTPEHHDRPITLRRD